MPLQNCATLWSNMETCFLPGRGDYAKSYAALMDIGLEL